MPHEDVAALAVDELALLVHHVVILQNALADGVVAALDALLRGLDLLGEHTGLQRLVLVMPSFSIMGAMRSEPKRRITSSSRLMKNCVEPGSPWRPARAAQLVVDAAALVALGADDVQAAQRHDALVLGVGLLFEALVEVAVAPARVQHHLIDVFVVAGGRLDDFVGVVFLTHGAAGQKVRVAAQQNVGAAAGHVGGDGHGAHVDRPGPRSRLPSGGSWR